MKKRLLSMFLAVVMIVMLVPFSAIPVAAEGGTYGINIDINVDDEAGDGSLTAAVQFTGEDIDGVQSAMIVYDLDLVDLVSFEKDAGSDEYYYYVEDLIDKGFTADDYTVSTANPQSKLQTCGHDFDEYYVSFPEPVSTGEGRNKVTTDEWTDTGIVPVIYYGEREGLGYVYIMIKQNCNVDYAEPTTGVTIRLLPKGELASDSIRMPTIAETNAVYTSSPVQMASVTDGAQTIYSMADGSLGALTFSGNAGITGAPAGGDDEPDEPADNETTWTLIDAATLSSDLQFVYYNFNGDAAITSADAATVDGKTAIVKTVVANRAAGHVTIDGLKLGLNVVDGVDWYTLLEDCDPTSDEVYLEAVLYVSDASQIYGGQTIKVYNDRVNCDDYWQWSIPATDFVDGWNTFRLPMDAAHLTGAVSFAPTGELPLANLSMTLYSNNVEDVDIGFATVSVVKVESDEPDEPDDIEKTWTVFDPATLSSDLQFVYYNFNGSDAGVSSADCTTVDGKAAIVKTATTGRAQAHVTMSGLKLGLDVFGGVDWYTLLEDCDPTTDECYFTVNFYVSDASKLASDVNVQVYNDRLNADCLYSWHITNVVDGWNTFTLPMTADYLTGTLELTADGALPLANLYVSTYTNNTDAVDIGLGTVTVTKMAPATGDYEVTFLPGTGATGSAPTFVTYDELLVCDGTMNGPAGGGWAWAVGEDTDGSYLTADPSACPVIGFVSNEAIDLSKFFASSIGKISAEIYVDDASLVNYGQFEICNEGGTDVQGVNIDFATTALTDGWNTVELATSAMNAEGAQTFDPSSFKASRLYLGTTAEGETLTIGLRNVKFFLDVPEGSIVLPQNTFTNQTASFVGWSDGTATYLPGTVYEVTADTTFTAQWAEKDYEDYPITIGGAWGVDTETTVDDVKAYTSSSCAIWCASLSPVSANWNETYITAEFYFSDFDAVTPIDDSFELNGANGTTAWYIADIDGLQTGWNSVTLYPEDAYNLSALPSELASTRLFVHCNAPETIAVKNIVVHSAASDCTVSFCGNAGATGTDPEAFVGPMLSTFTLPANPYTKTGYTFAGWFSNGYTYPAGATYTVTDNAVLRALWIPNDHQSESIYGFSANESGNWWGDPNPTRMKKDGQDGIIANVTGITDPAWKVLCGNLKDAGASALDLSKYDEFSLDFYIEDASACSLYGLVMSSIANSPDGNYSKCWHNNVPNGLHDGWNTLFFKVADATDIGANFDDTAVYFIHPQFVMTADTTIGIGNFRGYHNSRTVSYQPGAAIFSPVSLPDCWGDATDGTVDGCNAVTHGSCAVWCSHPVFTVESADSIRVAIYVSNAANMQPWGRANNFELYGADNDHYIAWDLGGTAYAEKALGIEFHDGWNILTLDLDDAYITGFTDLTETTWMRYFCYVSSATTFAVGDMYAQTDVATGTLPDSQLVNAGSDIELPECTLAVATEDYEFIGWSDGTATYVAGDEYTVTDDTVFTAMWAEAAEDVTVSFVVPDGAEAVDDIVRAAGSTILLPSGLTCGELSLYQWTDGTNTYAPGASYTAAADVTLTGVFKYVVEKDLVGFGTWGDATPVTLDGGSTGFYNGVADAPAVFCQNIGQWDPDADQFVCDVYVDDPADIWHADMVICSDTGNMTWNMNSFINNLNVGWNTLTFNIEDAAVDANFNPAAINNVWFYAYKNADQTVSVRNMKLISVLDEVPVETNYTMIEDLGGVYWGNAEVAKTEIDDVAAASMTIVATEDSWHTICGNVKANNDVIDMSDTDYIVANVYLENSANFYLMSFLFSSEAGSPVAGATLRFENVPNHRLGLKDGWNAIKIPVSYFSTADAANFDAEAVRYYCVNFCTHAGTSLVAVGDVYGYSEDEITFNVSFGTDSDSYSYGESVTTPAAPTAEAGQVFTGWTDGAITVPAGSTYVITADKAFTAAFATEQFTASFATDAGTGDAPEAITADYNSSITLPANTFTNDGYTFAGWSDGTTTYEAGASYTITADVTFTAVWDEIQVSFQADDIVWGNMGKVGGFADSVNIQFFVEYAAAGTSLKASAQRNTPADLAARHIVETGLLYIATADYTTDLTLDNYADLGAGRIISNAQGSNNISNPKLYGENCAIHKVSARFINTPYTYIAYALCEDGSVSYKAAEDYGVCTYVTNEVAKATNHTTGKSLAYDAAYLDVLTALSTYGEKASAYAESIGAGSGSSSSNNNTTTTPATWKNVEGPAMADDIVWGNMGKVAGFADSVNIQFFVEYAAAGTSLKASAKRNTPADLAALNIIETGVLCIATADYTTDLTLDNYTTLGASRIISDAQGSNNINNPTQFGEHCAIHKVSARFINTPYTYVAYAICEDGSVSYKAAEEYGMCAYITNELSKTTSSAAYKDVLNALTAYGEKASAYAQVAAGN